MEKEFDCKWVVYDRVCKKFMTSVGWTNNPEEFFSKSYAEKATKGEINYIAAKARVVVDLPR